MGEVVGLEKPIMQGMTFQCQCGCRSFYVLPDHIECVACGNETEWSELFDED